MIQTSETAGKGIDRTETFIAQTVEDVKASSKEIMDLSSKDVDKVKMVENTKKVVDNNIISGTDIVSNKVYYDPYHSFRKRKEVTVVDTVYRTNDVYRDRNLLD